MTVTDQIAIGIIAALAILFACIALRFQGKRMRTRYDVTCPKCKAKPQQHCRSLTSGKVAPTHAARVREQERQHPTGEHPTQAHWDRSGKYPVWRGSTYRGSL